MSVVDTEPEVVKIKVQKRSPSERQLESVEKARKIKLQKKLLKDAQPEKSDFFLPSQYLIITGIAGFGLLGYFYLSRQGNSDYTHISSGIPQQIPAEERLPQPQNIQSKALPSKEDIFLGNSIRI